MKILPKSKDEIEEFIKDVEALKNNDYINFIKIKSFVNGILVAKGQSKVNI